MAKIFEDEFMDVQSAIISLCLELVKNKADKVYAYGSLEKKTTFFNAFFQVEGSVRTINTLDNKKETAWRFLDLGMSDLEKIRAVCDRYGMPTPTEMKMVYDVATGKYDASYLYEEVCSPETGKESTEVFMNWVSEVKKGLA